MSKQAVVDNGKVLVVDTDKGTYVEAKHEDPGHIPILSDIADAIITGVEKAADAAFSAIPGGNK